MRIELIAEIDGQKVKGLSQMKALADNGNIEALNLLGEWMMMGFECSPDPDFYVSCFKEAANKGNTQGMLNLAVCFMEERGVPADFYAAERWIRAAIEGGDIEGFELFKELYLTTIGNHKPDVRAYVRTMKAIDPSGSYLGERVGGFERIWMSEEELEQRLMANLVLGSRGKSVKEIRKIKNKLTDADIEGYARLQDIHHDETEAVTVKRDYVADKAKTLSDFRLFIPNADREQLFIAVRAVHKLVPDTKVKKGEVAKSKLGGKVIGLAQRSEMVRSEDIQEVLDILYSSLNWRTKATFDLDDELFNRFEESEVSDILNLIGSELDRIENNEIQSRFDNSSRNWKALIDLITEIKKIEYYSSDIVSQWVSHITEKITELQEQEISGKFNRSQSNYFAIVELYNFVNGADATDAVKSKWLHRLNEVALSLQHTELERLCIDLESKQLDELYKIQNQVENYSFDKKTLATYSSHLSAAIEKAQNEKISQLFNKASASYDSLLSLYAEITESTEYIRTVATFWTEKITSAISSLQKEELDKLLVPFETLSYAELIKLHQKAEHYSFDKSILKKEISGVELLIDQKEQAHLTELCAELESFNAPKLQALEEKIIGLRYKDKNTQKYLSRIKDLMKNKDILDRCSLNNLEDYDIDQLDDLVREVHFSTISISEKELLIARINKQREVNERCEAEIESVISSFCEQIIEDARKRFQRIDLYGTKKSKFENYGFLFNTTVERDEELRIYNDEKFDSLLKEVKTAIVERSTSSKMTFAEGEKVVLIYTHQKGVGSRRYFFVSDRRAYSFKEGGAVNALDLTRMNNVSCNGYLTVKNDNWLIDVFTNDDGRSNAECDAMSAAFTKTIKDILLIAPVVKQALTADSSIRKELKRRVQTGDSQQGIRFLREKVGLEKPKTVKSVNTSISPKTETAPTFSTATKADSTRKVQAIKCEKCGAHYPADMATCPTCRNQGSVARTCNSVPVKPQSAVATPQPTNNTQSNGFANLIQKGLGHLQRNLSELKDSEVSEAVLALALKHSTRGYLAVGTESFNNKIGKAKAAYAKISIGERVLAMADDTIFGSAKEGFVLTDKHIYINISGCKNKCVAIADITSVYSVRGTGLSDIMVSAPSGNYRMSYRSDVAEGEACKNFLFELIHYLNPNCSLGNGAPVGNTPTSTGTSVPAQSVMASPNAQNTSKWQCSCGNINTGKFCSKCGSKKEDGITLWICSCGSLNKGKFCPKCGSPKKEE